MSFMPWDPFADLRALRKRIDRIFEERLSHSLQAEAPVHSWAPVVDIFETEEALILEAELSGVKQEEIEIELTGDTLTIRGERKADSQREYLRQERNYGVFLRAFTLGLPIDHSKVKANYSNGLLQITLPKALRARQQQVKVEVD